MSRIYGGLFRALRVVDERARIKTASWACLMVILLSVLALFGNVSGSVLDAHQEDEEDLEEPGQEDEARVLRTVFVVVMLVPLAGLASATVYLFYRAVTEEL